MKKLTWKENSGREQMRGKEEPAFEWWTAEWFIVNCHAHNKDGKWKGFIRGVREITLKREYETKEEVFDAIESVIEKRIKDSF